MRKISLDRPASRRINLPTEGQTRIIATMKRLLRPLVLTCLLSASFFAGTDIATAATKAVYAGAMKMVLNTGSGNVFASSISGLGFAGKTATQTKSAGAPSLTPVDVRFNADPQSEGMTRVLAYLAGKGTSLDASVKLLDMNYAVKQQIILGNSSIVELELPGGNATEAKQPATFRMRLQPSQLNVQAGTDSVTAESQGKTKAILASNFRVSVNGVAEPNVVQVLSAVVKRVGKDLQISGLGVSLPQTQALSGEWQKWSATALSGGEQPEKTLRIEYLDPALTAVLLTVEFSDVNIVSMDLPDFEANSDKVARVTFGLSARGVSIK